MPTYDLNDFERVANSLDKLEPEPKKSVTTARGVIEQYYDKIQSSLSRGVGHQQVLSFLQEGGLTISMSTFRQYLRETQKERVAAKSRATREANRLKSQSRSRRTKNQKEN